MMESGVWQVSPCCPCVEGGCRGPLRLYGVPLVVSPVGNHDAGGRHFVHLSGVGEVAGVGDLGSVVLG